MFIHLFPFLISLTLNISSVNPFSSPSKYLKSLKRKIALTPMVYSSTVEHDSDILSLSLEKPIGIVLEEVAEDCAEGVFVKSVNEGGSAFQYIEQLTGLKLSKVEGEDVTQKTFDEIMGKIIDAPSPVTIDFEMKDSQEKSTFEIGTQVKITVHQEGKQTIVLQGTVGDNLRQTLLANNIEVYRGLKKKLGNCGGGGQCTFCAVEFIESEGWLERSDYEDSKLKNAPKSRLSCLNNIQGPATILIK